MTQPSQTDWTPVMVTKEKYDELKVERDHIASALEQLAGAADWYRRCLEDMVDARPVRALKESRMGYDEALDRAYNMLARRGQGDL